MSKWNMEYLKQLQSLPLDAKIQITIQRVDEWVQEFGEEGVYISFSGGKDSTVLLDIIRSKYPNMKAMYVDTGLEYPEIKQFVKSFDNVDIIRPDMSFREVIIKFGYPIGSKDIASKVYSKRKGQPWADKYFDYENTNRFTIPKRWRNLVDASFNTSHYCCNIIKKRPAHKYEKQTGRKAITGTMTSESTLRLQQWFEHGCNGFNKNNPSSNPMSFWNDQDVYKYIKEKNLRICSIYGDVIEGEDGLLTTSGLYRTGCVYCAFGVHKEQLPNRFQKLEITHPKLYEYCMRPISNGGLGMKEVLEYCDIPYTNKTIESNITPNIDIEELISS